MTTEVEVSGVSAQADGSSILVAENVTMRFGGLVAVDSVDFQVHRGEIMGLIGPNGAGKTTFFNCLTGLYIPTEGRVVFDDAVLPPKPRKVVIAGMARTFQNIRLFGNMTSLENVMVGRYCRTTTGPLTSIIRGPKFRRDEKATTERAQELLDFVGLGHTTEHLARNLSYGDRVLCLVQGRALIEGTPTEVQSDPRVIEAYIGTGPEDAAELEAFEEGGQDNA
jgi:branched-chain amino acid transport system ATP-binding protein